MPTIYNPQLLLVLRKNISPKKQKCIYCYLNFYVNNINFFAKGSLWRSLFHAWGLDFIAEKQHINQLYCNVVCTFKNKKAKVLKRHPTDFSRAIFLSLKVTLQPKHLRNFRFYHTTFFSLFDKMSSQFKFYWPLKVDYKAISWKGDIFICAILQKRLNQSSDFW